MTKLISNKFTRLDHDTADGMSAYQHVDNGGHTISVDEYANVTIETGFFGYSNTRVRLNAVDLDGLIEFLQDAKKCQAAKGGL